MAHELQPDQIPPMIQMRVTEEQLGIPGRDYFHPGAAERLFDTPAAIARVYRTVSPARRMVVDASASRDISGRPLTFAWKLLQGDPEKLQIRPLDERGSSAEIILHWHPSFPAVDRADMLCDRIDIGVFAHNGASWSMPGLISSFSLRNEKRLYKSDGRIASIDYGNPDFSGRYVDPLIDIPKRWRDDYRYTQTGQLLGWVRQHPGQPSQQFNHDGTLILQTDGLGRATRTQPVRYTFRQPDKQPAMLEQQTLDRTITYQYSSPTDFIGVKTVPLGNFE